jgi:hypothetical protein
MAAPTTTDTFSVELLGFAPGVAPSEAAAALAKVFGMDPARAVQLVKQVPVRVKGSTTPEVARRLATALLGIDANVRVKNDRTGAARDYTAGAQAADGPPSGLREPPGAAPGSERPPSISYMPGELGAYVPPGAQDPRAIFSAAHAASTRAPRAAVPPPAGPASSHGAAPGSGRVGSPLVPAETAAAARAPGSGRLGSPLVAVDAAQARTASSAPAGAGAKATGPKSPASHTNAAVEGETFTITLIGFASGTSPLDASQALSRVFGLSPDRAVALVGQVPVRVKGKASADVARRLATALLGVDANVVVKSELTGEEREYLASGSSADGPPSALREVPDPGGRLPSISYMPGELGAYVPPGAPDPRAAFSPASSGARSSGAAKEPIAAAKASSVRPPPSGGPSSSAASSPASDAAAAAMARATAAIAQATEAGAPSRTSATSVPPAADPATSVQPCPSCHKPRASDDARCPRCGYSRKTHKQECVGCGGAVAAANPLGSAGVASVAVLAVLALASLWFLGVLTGLGFALAPVAAAAAFRGRNACVRCVACKRPVDADVIGAATKKALGQSRTLHLLAAAVLGVLAVGPVSLYVMPPELVHEAKDVRFFAVVPRTHRAIETTPTDVGTQYAVTFGHSHEARNAHLAVEVYRLVGVDMPQLKVVIPEAELLRAVLVGALADIDAVPQSPTPLPPVDKVLGAGLEATFSGPDRLAGKARVFRTPGGFVVLFFAGRGLPVVSSPDGAAFLASLKHS